MSALTTNQVQIRPKTLTGSPKKNAAWRSFSNMKVGSRPGRWTLRAWQLALLVALFGLWHVLTVPGLVPHFLFSDDNQAAFFFGQPLKIFGRIADWFVVSGDIYRHLGVTLLETVLAFGMAP